MFCVMLWKEQTRVKIFIRLVGWSILIGIINALINLLINNLNHPLP